jgi:phosphoribosyl-ATP pyrophosphohydrolase
VLSEGGFDVVIANPPYVRQEEIKHLKEDLKLHYECYTGTSDLYVYFYERGIQLLKNNGTLCFISSNKFFRAGYGEKLREYLMQKASINTIIDFGDLPVFEATTYPCVLIATKNGTEARALKAIALNRQEQLERFEEIYRQEAITMQPSDLSIEGWRIEDRSVLALLEKIKKAGMPLGEYVEGKIFYGIKTGCNEAFIIDEVTKNRLIKEDKKSAEVIKPFLRGRDIKRYAIEDPGLYLLFIPWHFPLHEKLNIEGASKEAERAFKEGYPAIYKYLLQFKKQLESRNTAETGIRYEWYALQRCAASYWKEFEKPKIVWGNLGEVASFALDSDSYYINAPSCIISVGEKYLLAVLNSKLGDYFLHQTAAVRRGGYLEYKPMYVSQLAIAKPSAVQRRAIEEQVEKILAAKKKNASADTTPLEREIDQLVYKLYGLTEEEIKIVEGQT